jgi:putative aminopeptidase FrvX
MSTYQELRKEVEADPNFDWDDLYLDIESNSEGEAREMVKRAYLAGFAAGRNPPQGEVK